MKTLILTAGALALTAGVANADPIYRGADMGAAEPVPMSQDGYVDSGAVGQVDGPDYTMEEGAMPSGWAPQSTPEYREWTPNVGAGTSRSSSANQG